GTGRVKVLDFGLARATSEDAHLTQEGVIVGTPAYMAPEQARGKPVDARCDLFSLGCVLYRMTTGVVPFRGANALAVLRAGAEEPPAAPRQQNPEVPAALSNLILRLLAKERADRPSSAAAVVREMERLQRQPVTPSEIAPRRATPPALVPRKRRR